MKEKISKEYIKNLSEDFIKDFNDFANEEKVKKHNSAHAKMEKALDFFENNLELATEIFSEYLKSDVPLLRHDFAVYCLRLGINNDEALDILNEIKNNHLEVAPFIELYLPMYENPNYRFVAKYIRKLDKISAKVISSNKLTDEIIFNLIRDTVSKFDIDKIALDKLIYYELSSIKDFDRAMGYVIALEKTENNSFYLMGLEGLIKSGNFPFLSLFKYIYNYYNK